MLVFKFTCDEAHHLNSKLIAEKFSGAIGGSSKDIRIKEDKDVVKLYLGKEVPKNISITIEVTDEDLN